MGVLGSSPVSLTSWLCRRSVRDEQCPLGHAREKHVVHPLAWTPLLSVTGTLITVRFVAPGFAIRLNAPTGCRSQHHRPRTSAPVAVGRALQAIDVGHRTAGLRRREDAGGGRSDLLHPAGYRVTRRTASPSRRDNASAKAARVNWHWTTSRPFGGRCAVLCDLKPSGRHRRGSSSRLGGVEQVLRMFARPWRSARRVHDHHGRHDGGGIIGSANGTAKRPRRDPPLVETNVPVGAPQGSQGQSRARRLHCKNFGIKEPHFTGPARVFNSEQDVIKAILGKKIKVGEVIVIRYEGPKGGPSMPKMLTPTSAPSGKECSNRSH